MKNVFNAVLEVLKENILITVIILFAIIAAVVVSYVSPQLLLNENQRLYLFSASAQVIAAIYGLTLTGYIFFRNGLEKKERNDETLEGIIEELSEDYLKKITCISVLTFIAIVLCFGTISYEKGGCLNFLINVTTSAVVCDLFFILFFVITIMQPENIERVSNKIIQKNGQRGKSNKQNNNLELFVIAYQKIEKILELASEQFAYKRYDGNKKKLSNGTLVNILVRNQIISEELMLKLKDLIKYRNGLIHGSIPLNVSEDMMKSVDECSKYLEECWENYKKKQIDL